MRERLVIGLWMAVLVLCFSSLAIFRGSDGFAVAATIMWALGCPVLIIQYVLTGVLNPWRLLPPG